MYKNKKKTKKTEIDAEGVHTLLERKK